MKTLVLENTASPEKCLDFLEAHRPSFATVSGHRPNITCDNQTMRSRFLPVLSIFAGGLVYTVLPHDAFGAYDVASRAAITGAAAGVTCLLVLTLSKRWRRSH